MPTAHDSWKAPRWLHVGCLLLAACTDATSPGPGNAVKLGFSTEPSSATAGVVMSPLVAVAILDASGNTVTGATNSVTLTIAASAGGATLAGTTTVAAVNGIASFSGLRIREAGTGYTLKAETARLTGATSTAFDITPGPASKLQFTKQPANTMAGGVITPAVEVTVLDSVGNRVAGFGGPVTVALGDNSPPGTLSGTTVVNAVNGVATFSDLSLAPVASGYALEASAGSLTAATSAPFAIAPPAATLRITAVTSGGEPDPDGYDACVDPASAGEGATACGYQGPVVVGVNGTGTVTVDTGSHAVLLTGLAANCLVAGDNPRTVRADRGDTVVLQFAVACSASTLQVTTTTTGDSLDPDGYTVCVDPDNGGGWDYSVGSAPKAMTVAVCTSIAANGAATFYYLAPGSHAVELYGVADNCAVAGDNPRTVTVGLTGEMAFAVTCAATGSLRVTTATRPAPAAAGESRMKAPQP